ncbi:hypothetical protein K449DRAFT_449558 [Hypoxylon sp. EC38]|nr:hypothetical protein K449DRAFT_449558 [Hypoxylon sp. EC38]
MAELQRTGEITRHGMWYSAQPLHSPHQNLRTEEIPEAKSRRTRAIEVKRHHFNNHTNYDNSSNNNSSYSHNSNSDNDNDNGRDSCNIFYDNHNNTQNSGNTVVIILSDTTDSVAVAGMAIAIVVAVAGATTLAIRQSKKRLVAGHESALEASWARLLAALRDEIKYIEKHGSDLIPSIDYTDIDDAAKVAPFGAQLKRHGIGVIKGVVPLRRREQVRSRAHPHVLQAQRFAMSLWNTNNDDRLATRFPITYADRIRIESVSNGHLTVNGALAPTHEDSLIAAAAATSSTQIAQIDNGSLERWEQDGYGRAGLYDAVFKGDWESYDAWDPAGRINATSDLYNGAGHSRINSRRARDDPTVALAKAIHRLLPPTAFLRAQGRPTTAGSQRRGMDAYLDASNWALEKEQSTIIHARQEPSNAADAAGGRLHHLAPGPGVPVLQHQLPQQQPAADLVLVRRRQGWRPASDMTSMLVYTPAAPLTQTNALFLARQRKAFLRGHPGPDFDSTGTGLGSEAPHTGRLGEKDIREVGGEEGLQAMGLAPWSISSSSSHSRSRGHGHGHKHASSSSASSEKEKKNGNENGDVDADVDMDAPSRSSSRDSRSSSTTTNAEAEVVRLANIILFPDRYDFYMPTRASSPAPVSRDRGEKERERERERDRDNKERENSDRDKDRDKGKDRDK